MEGFSVIIDWPSPPENDDQDDGADDASIIWEYDPALGEPYLEPMRAMISHDSMETP
jgi:hypothetical protein